VYPARKYGKTGHRDWQAGPTVRQQETKWQARQIGSQEIRPDRSHQGTQSSRAQACMIYKQHKGIRNTRLSNKIRQPGHGHKRNTIKQETKVNKKGEHGQ
jgi:hypothetical protein